MGVFLNGNKLDNPFINGVSHNAFINGNKIWSNNVESCVTFISEQPRTITPKYTNAGVTLQYSLNGKNWINAPHNEPTPTTAKIYFRGQTVGTRALYAGGSASSNAWLGLNDINNKCAISGNLNYLICDILGGEPPTNVGASCFSYMFSGCTSIIDAPELPATTLGSSCYLSLFSQCSLKVTPELPATTLANNCYQSMFSGCSLLTSAPELPATTLNSNCYLSMFSNCISLISAPELPATTLATTCYQQMFQNCSSLNYIKVKFTTWSDTLNWVTGVQTTSGQFVCPSTLPDIRGNSNIPNNWNKISA